MINDNLYTKLVTLKLSMLYKTEKERIVIYAKQIKKALEKVLKFKNQINGHKNHSSKFKITNTITFNRYVLNAHYCNIK